MQTTVHMSLSNRLRTFGPIRSIYRALFGAEGRRRRKQLADFYSQFIKPGDLVFDIGANIGVYSEVFESLGARVVAVEPNPSCVKQIEGVTSRDNVTVVSSAIGETVGTGKLFLCQSDVLSSMSTEWIEKASAEARFQGISWDQTFEVPITTIAQLRERHGNPKFIKLDVEGFEERALAGMGEQPKFISFEYNSENMELADRCLAMLSPDSRFDFVIGEPNHLEIGNWVSRDEIRSRIRALSVEHVYGDIIAIR